MGGDMTDLIAAARKQGRIDCYEELGIDPPSPGMRISTLQEAFDRARKAEAEVMRLRCLLEREQPDHPHVRDNPETPR